MKKYVKKALFYIVIMILAMAESLGMQEFVYMRISLVGSLCLCVLYPCAGSVVLGAVCGFLVDVCSLSMPFYSLLYLYISFGCVWCVRLFVSVRGRTVFVICFLWLIGFCAGEIFLSLLMYESFSFGTKNMIFILINAGLSPIIYGVLKRAQF